ncbi:MAG: 4-hydroxythreonine-4-phosphate dehydrogenase PdxA [Chloroflexota bacterium]|jgi:4-hydroxythreonine-4-phosphate dehydrogenase
MPLLPRLALTMGDPVGVGPEVAVRAAIDPQVLAVARPVIVGDATILHRAAEVCALRVSIREAPSIDEADRLADRSTIAVVAPTNAGDGHDATLIDLPVGRVSARAGDASVRYVVHAVEEALAGRVEGIVTAPINKEAINAAGHRFAGHTELIAARTGTREAAMMLTTGALRVIHVTTHVAFTRVPALLTPTRLDEVIALFDATLRDLGCPDPRIAVAGLNPHAGEHGLFGTEEAEIIGPAVARARDAGFEVTGPWPPDTVFPRAARGGFDGVVAMYHDQGHVAVKMLGFDEGVNVSLGLPIVRTSVDHGTAFDIAGKGTASPVSMVEATRLAATLSAARASRKDRA